LAQPEVSVSLSISLKTRVDDFTKKVPKFLSLPPIQVYPVFG